MEAYTLSFDSLLKIDESEVLMIWEEKDNEGLGCGWEDGNDC